ncbi:MAG: hypothetical protein QNK04_04160 [Myxococcota bacterium]|nr:hypothetical protein [Myxococcota bacterium]
MDSGPSEEQFVAALERDDPIELQKLVIELALEADDREWAEVCCAQLARHRNANVRGNALLGFGHLARRFGRLDRRRVQRLIEIGLNAHNEYVRAQAQSAADDAETYLAWSFSRPPS